MKALVWTVTLVMCVNILIEAKTKIKYDDDKVFDEDDAVKSRVHVAEGKRLKRTWIYDPESELCTPLKCRRNELCLLESLYAAVCVGKKDIHRNNDIIVSKARYLAEEARKRAVSDLKDIQDNDQYTDDEDDDDEDDNDDDDVFYEEGLENENAKTLANNGPESRKNCTMCPPENPVLLCGTDNKTYSSLCRLDYHNCIHEAHVERQCDGLCPCKVERKKLKAVRKNSGVSGSYKNPHKYSLKKQTASSTENLLSANDHSKMDSTVGKDVYSLVPTDLKLDNKHYKYITFNMKDKKFKNINYSATEESKIDNSDQRANEVLDNAGVIWKKSSNKNCSALEIQSMGNRMIDWFTVIRASSKKQLDFKNERFGIPVFPSGCKSEVSWMFQHLDNDGDFLLSLVELYSMEHDENEHCIRPFLDSCDIDKDIFITPFEWCQCFSKSERPCVAIKRRVPLNVIGVYIPHCDKDGYYEKLQCHPSTGICWCVNKHGVEAPNSRSHGRVNCDLFPFAGLLDGVDQGFSAAKPVGSLLTKGKNRVSNSVASKVDTDDYDDDDNDDDEDDDDDDDIDGSGDKDPQY